MQFILIPHVFDGQDQWMRPKRAPKPQKVLLSQTDKGKPQQEDQGEENAASNN
jgi:hypothetical protein